MPGYGRDQDEPDALSDQEEDEKNDPNVFDIDGIPDINKTFRKTPLWEGKELPEYDDRDAGPANMPDGYKDFTPLGISLLLFPLDLWRMIVMQINLGHLIENPDQARLYVTLRELFVWVALHLMMMRAWTRSGFLLVR